MTKRTQQTKLTLYRRHAGSCEIDVKVTDQCECPLWIHGKVRGKSMRKSLDTRSLATGLQRKQDLINGRDPDNDPNGGLHIVGQSVDKGSETLEYAGSEFLRSNSRKASNTLILYKRAVEGFVTWAAKHELTALRQIEASHIQHYFEECGSAWNKTTAQGRLTHLRVWFNYCVKVRRWITHAPTAGKHLNQRSRGTKSSSRIPFTPEEITGILTAVERMPEADRDRARALIMLLLYSGMRISDATFFERAFVTPRNTADYYVIKTRKAISLPPELQQPALDALAKLPASTVYFLQPDRAGDYREARQALRNGEEFSSLVPNYVARVQETTALVRKVLALAGLEGACHRFRDTFALNLLVSGADIFTVSQMLGHSDVRITQEHYLKLIPEYRERMSQATRMLAYQFPSAA